MKLSDLREGQSAIIKKLNFTGVKLKEYSEIGLTQGITIKLIRFAPFNGPLQLSLRGFDLAIRVCDAEKIDIERLKD